MQEKRLGIRVHRVPTIPTEGNAQIYYDLKVKLEPDTPHPMFFTNDRIHQTLSQQNFSLGKPVGNYLLYRKNEPTHYKRIAAPDENQRVPLIIIQQAYPFSGFSDRPKQTGISSMAEQRILEDLVNEGLGHYSIEHNISLAENDFKKAVKPTRINQLCKRLGITGDPDNLDTYRRVKEELEKHTVASYLAVLRRYIYRHKTD